MTLDKLSRSNYNFKRLYLLNRASYTIFHEHIVKSYTVYGLSVYIMTFDLGWLYIILSVLLDSGAVRPRGLLFGMKLL